MSRILDLVLIVFVTSLIIILPLVVAVCAADHTRIGVLSYTLTNTEAVALRF